MSFLPNNGHRHLGPFFLSLLLALPSLGQSVATNLQAQLLQFCELPTMSFTLGFRFSTTEGFHLLGEQLDEDAEIASWPQKYNAAEKDPEALAQVGHLLRKPRARQARSS